MQVDFFFTWLHSSRNILAHSYFSCTKTDVFKWNINVKKKCCLLQNQVSSRHANLVWHAASCLHYFSGFFSCIDMQHITSRVQETFCPHASNSQPKLWQKFVGWHCDIINNVVTVWFQTNKTAPLRNEHMVTVHVWDTIAYI